MWEENVEMKEYNKLVRDLIPNIIEKDGKKYEIEIANKESIQMLLEEKMIEEFNEYLEDKNLEELADMLEVIFGLAHHLGYSEEELIDKRKSKLAERGGFKEGIVLKKIY